MKTSISWLLFISIYLNLIAPMAAAGQNVSKNLENKMKDIPLGLKFRLSEGAAGAETRTTPRALDQD